jgi:hypothetical protein
VTYALQFNVRDDAGNLLCPACGFPDFASEPAYDERGGIIGIAICPCCLWEPGFDDNAHASAAAENSIVGSLRAYRNSWNGEPSWSGQLTKRPKGWDAKKQLATLFKLAPNVR